MVPAVGRPKLVGVCAADRGKQQWMTAALRQCCAGVDQFSWRALSTLNSQPSTCLAAALATSIEHRQRGRARFCKPSRFRSPSTQTSVSGSPVLGVLLEELDLLVGFDCRRLKGANSAHSFLGTLAFR